jgi:rare lipoprotein A
MILFGTADRDLRRKTLALCLGLGAVALAAVTCRTPPPLANAPSRADEPPEREAAEGKRTNAPSPSSTKAADPAPEAVAKPDFSGEQRELVARYEKRRALSTLRGEASYYGRGFEGRKTASGEAFEPGRFTAAHRTLPFGTVLRVTRVGTRSVVYVRVNDRGPFGKKRRILDLSEAAAVELDMLREGVCDVRVEVLERGRPP